MQLLMKNPICCIFGLYAANVLQYAAAMVFFGISDNNCSFLPQNAPNNDFYPFLTIFNEKSNMQPFWAAAPIGDEVL